MTVTFNLFAGLEVLTRHIIKRFPGLRKKMSSSVRMDTKDFEKVTLESLEDALRSLGVRQGDALMIHSSWDGMCNLQAKPSEVISTFIKLVGESGTLVFPTAPLFLGEKDGIPVYDIQKSPSILGLLSESFRREPDVARSPCPSATVSAWGKLLPEFTRDFREESGNKPYGYGSPYDEIVKNNGKILVIGIGGIRALSLFHSPFDFLGDDNPIANYHFEKKFLVRDGQKEEKWTILQHDPKWEHYYASYAFTRLINKQDIWEKANLNGIKLTLVDAKKFSDFHMPLARKYGIPYWGFVRKK